MSPRLLGAVLLGASALLYAGVVLPTRASVEEACEESRRVAAGQGNARVRLLALQRAAARRRAVGIAGEGGVGKGDALALVRHAVLASLEGARVSGVRIEVRPGHAPAAATVHLSAEGSSAEILRLSGHLLRPGGRLVLDRVRMSPTREGLSLDVDGFGLGGGS